MTSFEKYLLDKQKRLLEISDICYIKCTYTDNPIIFECLKEPTTFITKDINEVREWYQSLQYG